MNELAPNRGQDASIVFQKRRKKARTFFTLMLFFFMLALYFIGQGWEEVWGLSGMAWCGINVTIALAMGTLSLVTYRCPACGNIPSSFSFDGMSSDANPDHCTACGAKLR